MSTIADYVGAFISPLEVLLEETIRSLEFTVAICTLNRCHYLARTVSAVLGQLADFERGSLLVVDNGSDDATPEYLDRLTRQNPHCRKLQEERRGLYYARCAAIENARGNFLVFIDDDAIPQPGWLQNLLIEITSRPDIGVVGCAIDPIWEKPKPAWLSKRLLREIPVYDLTSSKEEGSFPSYPSGISLALRLNACSELYIQAERRANYPLGRVGTHKGVAMWGGEDNDLCEIYLRNGFKAVSIRRARVFHNVAAERLTPDWFVRKYSSEGRLRIRLARLAGYRVVGKGTVGMLAGLPAFAVLKLLTKILPLRARVHVDAYYGKCRSAWSELIFGARVKPLPYLT
jgi:GT2 family glycosyltransferase